MNFDNSLNIGNLDTEIVIIGGGGSGLCAAISAVENGAKVIVLEERKTLGGNTVFPEALFAVESPVQKRLNIEARKDDFFKKDLNYSHHKTNPRIIRALINKSGDTVRWLEEMGVTCNLYPSTNLNPTPQVSHCPVGGGAAVVKALVKRCEELGIRVLYQVVGRKIVTDQAGKIIGLIALSNEQEVKITAKGLIIATGGYAGNKELVNKYCPSFARTAHLHGLPNMGTGLTMAMEIGAATEGLGILHLSGPYYPWKHPIWPLIKEPNMLWVNRKGERFIDETIGSNHFEAANPVSRQPDGIAYSLFDNSIKLRFIEQGFIKGLGLDFRPGSKLPDLDNMLNAEAEQGRIKISNSWNNIAEWIGADTAILTSTLDEYNSFCDQGYDAIFGKDPQYLMALREPPYYGVKTGLRITTTIGGIKINQNMEVLDGQLNSIPGIYACGVDAGGWESDTYNLTLPGKAFGFALNSGRIAGENAASYVKNEG
jgi:fumarate reductase flavoprotein subunit